MPGEKEMLSTFWDDFLEEHKGRLPSGKRELLKTFYFWLVDKGTIQ